MPERKDRSWWRSSNRNPAGKDLISHSTKKRWTLGALLAAIDITLQRFAEYQSLQGACGRRAAIEQAKGILMARHSIGADAAFERLREHSRHNGRKLADVAAAVVESHLLLTPTPPGA
jgi:hypothetical protein